MREKTALGEAWKGQRSQDPIRKDSGPSSITRENAQRKMVIMANVAGRDLGSVVADVRARVEREVDLPEGYYVVYGGQFESQERASRTLAVLAVAVVVAIFLVLQLAFASARRALLVMHSPIDGTVPIDNATGIFVAAKHPKSFVSLDTADHLLTRREDAHYAATVLAAWAGRFVPLADPHRIAGEAGEVVVAETREGKFTQAIAAAGHALRADEPQAVGVLNVRIKPIVDLRRNSNIMRTALYSIERLLSFFKVNITATMTQLKAVLGTTVDMTVYRKLRKLSYLTSYSHHGKYYTLNELTRFDSLGLWRHSDARFSKYGTLINTARALVTLAEKGYSLSELRRIVGCEVKETVLTLVRQNRIHREIIDGQFVYFAANLATQQKQNRLRMKAKTRPGDQEPDVLAHEVRAAIILFVSLLDEKQRRLYAGRAVG